MTFWQVVSVLLTTTYNQLPIWQVRCLYNSGFWAENGVLIVGTVVATMYSSFRKVSEKENKMKTCIICDREIGELNSLTENTTGQTFCVSCFSETRKELQQDDRPEDKMTKWLFAVANTRVVVMRRLLDVKS